jgi:hypothetical protein
MAAPPREESISGPGYIKRRGHSSISGDMTIGVNHEVVCADRKVLIHVQLGLTMREGDRPLIDLEEHEITLPLDQAREFARRIIFHADYGEQFLQKLSKKSAPGSKNGEP